MLVLWSSHGAAHTTPHHAAAVLHHSLVCGNHSALGKICHFCGVILKRFDGGRVGRGLDDDDSLLGHLIGFLDLVLVPEDRVKCWGSRSAGRGHVLLRPAFPFRQRAS